MKNIQMKIAIVAGAVAFAMVLSLTAFSRNAQATTVKALDSININNRTLAYAYTVNSRCPASSHDNSLLISTVNIQKLINSFVIKIMDSANESQCSGALNAVAISGTIDLASAVRSKSREMMNRGYRIDPEATVVLPPVRSAAFANANVGSGGGVYSGWQNRTSLPSTVDVVFIDYTPIWRCTLYKNDNSLTDGFEGTGATMDEARRNASANCKATYSPYCDQYSNSPDHTTCDSQLQETTRVGRYNTNNLPAGTTRDAWKCVLNRNDGLSGVPDGFEGFGNSESAARANAASKCSATSNSNCNYYSTDVSHTACARQMVVYGPKPSTVWNCTLRKNDGSRNDGFNGSGSTESEARNNTISGCQTTSNPYCTQYANDPAHTECSVAFVNPQ